MLMEELEALVPEQCRAQVGGTRIFAIGEGLDFGVDAIIVEQDTARVLEMPEVIAEPRASYPELVAGMGREDLPKPGSVIVEAGYPLKLHAIVHDLDSYPGWRLEWIEAALERVREELASRSCESLVMPMLAVRHGTLQPEVFTELLGKWLAGMPGLKRLYLVLPADVSCSVLVNLR